MESGRGRAPGAEKRQHHAIVGTSGACKTFQSRAAPVVLELRLGRWRCLNEGCARKTFVERLTTAFPFARKTQRVSDLVGLFGHAAGGRTSEKLLARLAMPVSDNAILRQLKRHSSERRDRAPLRAIAIDDWSWRKGFNYGTIVVDLERRIVADVLETRSAKETADWVKQLPEIEVVSRDRCGLYAQGVRLGAPQARQVADRFHLLQNLRESIERHMTRVSRFAGRPQLPPTTGDCHAARRGERGRARQALFDRVSLLRASGKTFVDIAAQIGVDHRTDAKWVKTGFPLHRRRLALKPTSPLYFQEFLARRWAEGDRVGRRLFHDLRHRGYTGSFSNLERLLSTWHATGIERRRPEQQIRKFIESRAVDPATGWQISPVIAASLCMKPTRRLTPAENAKVVVLKQASPSFVVMRQLAMRFRSILRGDDPDKLNKWLHDAKHSGVRSMQQFARALSRDIEAVRNAIVEHWSSGQAEGQINRLKAFKRAMYGRAGIDLLRARMLPFETAMCK
ncbi:ISL3 family transposase [Methylocystis silviterrae]|uniref:ISL3 family transposase n=1 Tax=Methylocystis silviterrae TaxID=2743612 RepID=UPI003C71E85C